jgi:hypothetical protein
MDGFGKSFRVRTGKSFRFATIIVVRVMMPLDWRGNVELNKLVCKTMILFETNRLKCFVLTFALAGLLSNLASANSGPPKVSSFLPVQGIVGTTVQIKGANLKTVTSVEFNGVKASFTLFADLVLASVPANATTGPISVTTAQGADVTPEVFKVTAVAAPIVSSFSPTTGNPGATIEIQGSNFSGVTAIQFNGVNATFRILPGLLLATVPANATSGPITVTTSTGKYVTTEIFSIARLAGPVITAFSPETGAAGESVQISGTNLAGVTLVKFNGKDASFSSFGGFLHAIVPANATSGPITVIAASGTNTTSAQFVITKSSPPVVTEFTPASGGPGTIVEIRGQDLRDVTAVRFNGVDAAITNSLFRPLAAFVPTNATTGPITVVTAAGTYTTTDLFSVVRSSPPVIASISPENGLTGSIIEIRGTDLSNVLEVKIKEVPAIFIEFSSVRLRVLVPLNASTGPITITTRSGTTTSTETFQVTNAPSSPDPVLSVRALGQNQIELSWPSDATDFALQIAESLQSPIRWTNATGSPELSAGRRVVAIDRGVGQRFFRLARP